MGGWVGIVGLSLVGALTAPAQGAPARPPAAAPGAACRFDIVGSGRVAGVPDGRSLMLEDGREVRLAGIEVPPASNLADRSPGDTGPGAAAAARAALESLVLGHTVELRQRQPVSDRYGRILAFVSLADAESPADAAEPTVAHTLIGRGFARVGAGLDEPACTAELLSRERVARGRRLGLWGEADYAIMSAENGAELLGQEGRFAVVEGKVASVRESGGLIYMNFGRRWSQALTVTIMKRHERSFAAAGLQPDRLANLRLRVRGYIEERSGPRIEATRPEQIEIAEGK
ncbi:MAG TPA: thermonuclease family protein [Xanthobacteraceae bacterium]|jgi:endonuclease YncB( thermonuclease family)